MLFKCYIFLRRRNDATGRRSSTIMIISHPLLSLVNLIIMKNTMIRDRYTYMPQLDKAPFSL